VKPRTLAGAAAAILFASLCFAQGASEPIPVAKLTAFLPDAAAGFVADKPEGSLTAPMGFRVTTVSRTYHRGKKDADTTVSVKITDGTGNDFFAAAHATAGDFAHKTASGDEKGFQLDGYPAVERYDATDEYRLLTVFVRDRFLIEIESHGLDSDSLQDWWRKLDVKKLETFKPSVSGGGE